MRRCESLGEGGNSLEKGKIQVLGETKERQKGLKAENMRFRKKGRKEAMDS